MNIPTNQLPADFLTATEILALNLASSEPIVAYLQALQSLDADRPAQALLQRLGQVQSELRARQARGTITQADVEQLRALQREVQSNHLISNYASTQQGAVDYLRQVNQEISQLLGIDFAALARPTGGCC